MEILAQQPPWLVCLVLGLIGIIKIMQYRDLPFHGKVANWTVIIFFWLTIAIMIKELLGF